MELYGALRLFAAMAGCKRWFPDERRQHGLRTSSRWTPMRMVLAAMTRRTPCAIWLRRRRVQFPKGNCAASSRKRIPICPTWIISPFIAASYHWSGGPTNSIPHLAAVVMGEAWPKACGDGSGKRRPLVDGPAFAQASARRTGRGHRSEPEGPVAGAWGWVGSDPAKLWLSVLGKRQPQ
jgi:hypothetical protein